jgi:hypothetical protein
MTAIAKRESEAVQPVVQPPSGQLLALQQSPMIPRIQLARMFPRPADLTVFKDRLRGEVLADPAGMVYRKPQAGTHIIGPSVRMAEIAARLFQNIDVAAPAIEEKDGRVTATVVALDLESNVSVPGVASTSLVDSKGHRMRADIVSNLISATAAKARRNAIFQIIGKAVFDELVGPCQVAEEKRAQAEQQKEKKEGKDGEMWRRTADAWARVGIKEAELLRACKVATPAELTPKMYADLRAAWTAVSKETVPPRVALGLEDDAAPPETAPSPANPDLEAFFENDKDTDE